jgi:predicted AAA+ superfamily ATPase
MPRRSGKTTLLASIARDYENVVVIGNTVNMAVSLSDMIEQRTSLVAMSAQNWRQVSRGRDTPQRRIIIIDEVFQIEASIVYFLSSATNLLIL